MTTRKSEFIEAFSALYHLRAAADRIAFDTGDTEAAELYGLLDNIDWELTRLEKEAMTR